MILLTGAGLLFRSFVGVLHTDIGFHPENILTVQLGLTNSTSPSKTAQFYRDVIQRIAEMPGVRAVGGAGNLFFLEEKRTHALRQVEGRPPEPKSSWTPLVWTQISGDYFQAMGIPVLAGRYFNHHDGPATPPVAIVNETLARRYWRGENPVGRRLKGFDPRGRNDDWVTVVGVVKDTRSGGLEKPAFSQIYEVQEQSGEQIGNLVVRTATDPALIAGSIRTLIHQANRNAIVSSITTMEQLLDRQVVERRFETWLIGVFSAFALSLAALGVFAVMYYSVASKTHEIGVRMALGACATDMTAFVLRQGARLALTGIMVGTLGALWSSYAIAGMLYKVKPSDPISFVGAGLTLAVVALLGSYVPARRASHVDPMTALRQD
jgi:putative ABC transport system permease protein